MIDTHSHLFDEVFENDLENCILRAKKVNIDKIILVGFSLNTNEKAWEMSQRDKIFYPTAGLHPSEASPDNQKNLLLLEEFILTHQVYAIGECGLDYHYGKENIDEQKELFEGQIMLAIKYKLPLIIHMRDATQDTFSILKKYMGMVQGVMHCYSGSYEMALEFIKLGFYISIGGVVTFKNAVESKKIIEKMDLNKLLVETDCPYLAPVPYRGKRNESSFVALVVEEIARIRKKTFREIEEITSRNAISLFGMEERI